MSEKKNSTALVPTRKKFLACACKKRRFKNTILSLVDQAIYLNNKKDVQAIYQMF